ncbi:MAG: hypothetical protein WBX02_09565 [Terriglobales bacterium]
MDRDKLRRLLRSLRRALLIDRRLTHQEFHQLLEPSEAIIDHGRMIQAHRESFAPYVIVEIPELASRFRETQRTIKDALALLRDMDRAEPLPLRGCWKLLLAKTLRREEDEADTGAA